MVKKEKFLFNDEITCAYCSNRLKVKISKEVVVPAVKGQTRLNVSVEKSDQTSLKAVK
jgi:copper chaperone CopZ